jgi:hypothetical protein
MEKMTMMNFARFRKAPSVVDPYKLLLAICVMGAACLSIPSARGATGITLIQSAGTDAGTTTSASLSFTANNAAGDFIAVCIRAGQAGEVFTVSDSRGNTYHQAVEYNVTVDAPSGNTLGIFYAQNISSGANTITVSDSGAASMRFAIWEYSGVALGSALDATAVAQGNSALPNTGIAATTSNGDLALGVFVSADPQGWTAGTGYSLVQSVPAEPNTKLIAENSIQTTAGTISASASLGTSDPWGAGLATFKANNGPTIMSLSPNTGPAGTSVTIQGANFGAAQGTSSVNFNGAGATTSGWSATSIVAAVPATAASGSVVVTVGGVASNGMSFTVPSSPGSAIALSQHASKDAGQTTNTTLAFNANNTAGNWIGVCIRAQAPNQVFTVSDSRGNTYRKAVQFSETTDGFSSAIFYAENIAGGANAVTVSDTIFGILRIAILEYSGVATSGSLDVTATAQGQSNAPSTGASVSTTANGDLLLATAMTTDLESFTAGAGFQIEESVPAEPGTKLMVEDQIQAAAGPVIATATLGAVDDWDAGFAAFRPPSAGEPSIPEITSVNPASGPVNTAVTISGTNFGSPQGTSTLKFNGTAATPNSWTATSIAAPVPAGATSGNVSLNVGGVTSNGVSFTVTSLPSISAEPASAVVTVGQSATFSVTAAGTAPLSYQWKKNGVSISGATAASYTTPAAALTDSGATFLVAVSNSVGTVASSAATLTVNTASTGTDVTTYHNDIGRTGQNLTETILTTANVNSTTFGLKHNLMVDGLVDAQPLYLSQLSIAGAVHNVVFVATENDSVYAFDSDTGAQLWRVSMLGASETPSDSIGCGQVTPEIGVTSTPVIDRAAGLMFVVAMSKNGSTYFQRLHALNITTGADALTPVAIQATYPGSGAGSSNGTIAFNPEQYVERPALLLLNGVVYTAWGSHCDQEPYTGWIIGYNETNLARTTVLNLAPNGSDSAIWQAGGGLAADSQGNIYALIANGTFDTTLDANGFPNKQDYGNAFVRVSTTGGSLKVADYFNMFNTVNETNADTDLGSGGVMLLPNLTNSSGGTELLAVGAGKDGHLYVVDRTNMGKFNSSSNNIYQDMAGVLPNGVWSVPAYFNNTVYYCDEGDNLKAFSISNAMLSTTPTQTATSFEYPGTLPSVSANGSSNGIVWAIENSNPAVLHAYLANNLTTEIYNSNQAANGRDNFGNGNKFITPTIADGKVFAPTTNSVAVFGLLP